MNTASNIQFRLK